MFIDSHAHVMEPIEKQLSWMEEAGVDQTILFSTATHPERAADLAAFEQEIRRLSNILAGNCDGEERKNTMQRSIVELSDAIKKHPEHFGGFGPVPLGLGEHETADWISEKIIGNGFLGVGEFTPGSGGVYLLENILKALMKLGKLPVWIHTFHPMTSGDLKDIAGLAGKYPRIPIILGHMGGAYWLDAIKIAKDQANLYLDFSASVTAIAPQFAMKELPERCLFSSDAPYGHPMLVRKMVETVSEDPVVTEMVLGGNIQRLLNVD